MTEVEALPFSRDADHYMERLELLLDVSRRVAATATLDEVLETLVDMVAQATGAERATLFLNDARTGELYSRVVFGDYRREIRVLNSSGVIGDVFQAGTGRIVHDAYADERFDRSVDERTGYVTRSMLCAPVRTVNGEVIGVVQALNRKEGRYSQDDLALLEAMATQAAIALQSTQLVERIEESRVQERQFLDVVSEVSSEIHLGALLRKIMGVVTRMLNAERSTLFLNEEKTGELWSEVGEGLGAQQIRLPNTTGIAGSVFTSGETINIPHAYADLRFNPAFDRRTGFFTRSILCVPVVNKDGKRIGVTQVLNKRGGPFTSEDESRLKAFTAQVSIALENAKLFADVQNMKNYNESMLQSMSNGVITLDGDERVITCNAAGLRIFRIDSSSVLGRTAAEWLGAANTWVLDKVRRVEEKQESEVVVDGVLQIGGERVSVNLTVVPLVSGEDEKLGTMLLVEDISREKRIKSTMARYMDPALADRLLAEGEEILGGQSALATVLFSDIRSFTSLTEELGAQGTVSLLNEYFTLMVDCIQSESGMLDKFIGDAIMATFGIPLPHDDDEDRAVKAAVAMMRELATWNRRRLENGLKPVDIGIGLNTDTVVSGNIGSPKRMDFTVIGDGVNLASRLESACKQYGAHILVSENTYKRLKGTYRSREADRVIVKGKTEPSVLYEVLDYHTEGSFPNIAEVLSLFKLGQEHYRRGVFDRARSAFEQALKLHPGDALSQLYVERCRRLMRHPPGESWSGVWRLSEK
ncbi:MAG TPA: GAF domain-containing protein [Thermoanaerobaculia bacterium]|nr:GAF domain-containing protein [Thermoanaerobaculia bacterium]